MEVFFTHLWKSALLITLFYGFYRLFLQKETYFQSIRYFLLSGIILSLVIPFISIIQHIELEPIEVIGVDTSNSSVVVHKTPIDWIFIGLLIYSAVAIGLFIKFLVQLASIGTLIYTNKYQKLDGYSFVETNSKTSPFSFFRYIVYNPLQFEPEELKQILTHEKAHVIQKHSIDTIISNILVIMLWFNPFAWFYKKNIGQNLEFIADEYAQTHTESQYTYQQLLLKTTIPNYQMTLANNFYNSLLKKRIIMLHTQRSNNKSQWKFIVILPILLIFVFAFNTKTVAQQKSSTKTIVNIDVDIFTMTLSKKSSKADLKNISNAFQDEGLTVKFSNIKRNSNSEITAIKIDAKSKNGKTKASHHSNLTAGINPIQISFDNENNSLNIGSSEHSAKGTSGSFVFVSSDDDDTTSVTKKARKKITVESHFDENEDDDIVEEVIKITTRKGGNKTKKVIILDGKVISEKEMSALDNNSIKTINVFHEDDTNDEVIKITTKNTGNQHTFILNSNNKNAKPLFILNGKEITKKEMDALDADTIERVNVYKGAKAIEKYGKKGKNGVVVITSK